MKMNRLLTHVAGMLCAAGTLMACGDLVIKVQKKPKDVDLAALENFEALNLTDSKDFLAHLDNLKVIAADLLIKQLAKRDYRHEVRTAVREYRRFLIERATKPVKVDDSFYFSDEDCRRSGLDFNLDEANDFLGIMLKTAVLARMGEVSAVNLNPEISKELAAIGQMILMELGLKIEGDVQVDKSDDATMTSGKVTIALAELTDEEIDEETKKSDAAEIITISFTRVLGDDYIGTFNATMEVGHLTADGSTETLAGKIDVEREAVDDSFLHSIAFSLGVKDGATNYARKATFTQVDGDKYKLKVVDTLNAGMEGEKSFTTMIDVKAGSQCKVADDDQTSQGDEGGFIPTDDDEKPTADDEEPADEDKPTADEDEPTAEEPTPDEETPTTDKPTADDDDDDEKPTDDGETPIDTPTQNHPGQNTPTQSQPTQS